MQSGQFVCMNARSRSVLCAKRSSGPGHEIVKVRTGSGGAWRRCHPTDHGFSMDVRLSTRSRQYSKRASCTAHIRLSRTMHCRKGNNADAPFYAGRAGHVTGTVRTRQGRTLRRGRCGDLVELDLADEDALGALA